MPVQVFSGIAPPPALLSRMATSPRPAPVNAGVRPPSYLNNQPQTPITPHYHSFPPQQGEYGSPATTNDDAPPSYEDAIAEDIGPVDGPRREYNQPSIPPIASNTSTGSKTSGERLFPETESREFPRALSNNPFTPTSPASGIQRGSFESVPPAMGTPNQTAAGSAPKQQNPTRPGGVA